ncbi:MAG: E3 ubiquitin-protein ligase bre1 [Cirrosporium novae-zelandiae]|nr:MAG: E3 ubiquitin-protein ligase bre1 [Cirrosporium novae-zelandiae]
MKVNDPQTVVLPVTGLVKMEDRKRPASYDNHDHAPPSKRQATSANGSSKSHQDSDMPWKDDLEYIQKDAILRQLQEYKRERNTLESRIKELNKRYAYHDDHIRIIDAWFNQLLEEVKVFKGIPDSKDQGNALSSFPSSLLFADNEIFQEHLHARSENILAAITHLFSSSTPPSTQLTELQGKLVRLLASEQAHIKDLDKAQLEKEQLEERLENASLRYMVAEKKLDRARSITATKVEKGILLNPRRDSGSMSVGGESSPMINQEGPAAINGVTEDGDMTHIETARREAVAASEKYKEQLQQLEAENTKLTSEMTILVSKLSHLSDDDYAKTDLFKQLKTQHEDVIKRINDLEATNVQLREEAQKLQAERSAYRIQIEAESQTAIGEKESQLARMEMDLTRIRNARDEILADSQVLKASSEGDRAASKQEAELTAAKDDQIKALETEVERLRAQIDHRDDHPIQDIASMSPEELKTKYSALETQNSMLNQELSSMQAAYSKHQAAGSRAIKDSTELRERVERLKAEKAKADQKYFAAMKAKETRDGEVRTLRAQNTKSSEIVSQLKEAEAATRSLVVSLEKNLAEAKEAIASITIQYRRAEQQLNERKIVAEGFASHVEELKKILNAKDASLANVSTSNRRTEVELEELKVRVEESHKQLEKWKNRGVGSGKGYTEEYEALRAIALCPVCRVNFKNTVITTCGHVLCDGCVQERISSRSRKCPNCNHSFGLNDHMRVTL